MPREQRICGCGTRRGRTAAGVSTSSQTLGTADSIDKQHQHGSAFEQPGSRGGSRRRRDQVSMVVGLRSGKRDACMTSNGECVNGMRMSVPRSGFEMLMATEYDAAQGWHPALR